MVQRPPGLKRTWRLFLADLREVPHIDSPISRGACQAGRKGGRKACQLPPSWHLHRLCSLPPHTHIVSLWGDQASCRISSVCASRLCRRVFVLRRSHTPTVCVGGQAISADGLFHAQRRARARARARGGGPTHLVRRARAQQVLVARAEDDGIDLAVVRRDAMLWRVARLARVPAGGWCRELPSQPPAHASPPARIPRPRRRRSQKQQLVVAHARKQTLVARMPCNILRAGGGGGTTACARFLAFAWRCSRNLTSTTAVCPLYVFSGSKTLSLFLY
jgi:hypothetical protein